MEQRRLFTYNIVRTYLREFAQGINVPTFPCVDQLPSPCSGGMIECAGDRFIRLHFSFSGSTLLVPCRVRSVGEGNCFGAVVETLLGKLGWTAQFGLDGLCLWAGSDFHSDTKAASEQVVGFLALITLLCPEFLGTFPIELDEFNIGSLLPTLIPGDVVIFWGFPSAGVSAGRAYNTTISCFDEVHAGFISHIGNTDFSLDHKPGVKEPRNGDSIHKVSMDYPQAFVATIHRPLVTAV